MKRLLYSKNSIFWRTCIMIAAFFFLVLLSVFGVMYHTSVNAVKQQTLADAKNRLDMIRTYLDMTIERLTNSMFLYVQNDVLLSDDEAAIQDYFENYSELYTDIGAIMLLENDSVIASGNPTAIANRKIDTLQYYSMSKRNRLVITQPYYSTALAGRSIALIRSLTDAKSGHERLLVAEIRPNSLFSSLSFKLTAKETLVVLTPEGETVFFKYNASLLKQMISHGSQLDINDHLRGKLAGMETDIEELSVEGDSILVRQLRYNQRWKLYILTDTSSFYEALNNMKSVYQLIGIIAMILLIVVANAISFGVVWPIHQLSHQVETLSPQQQSIGVPISRSDEIGQLAGSFNNLLSRLQLAANENIRMERDRLEWEYKALQSQIQPHFLLNIHMSVTALLEQGKTEQARQLLVALDSLLRKSTDKIGQSITLSEELDTVREYGELQRMRLGDTFDIVIENWQPYAHIKVPKLLLQPIVENSIYHGFANLTRRGEVKIQFMDIDDYLHIIIEDNGCGIPEEKQKVLAGNPADTPTHGMVSIGLANVKRRIANLYQDGSGLYILSRESIGTRIEIVLRMRESITTA